jgi:predicted metal-dependent hydrolase
MIKSLENEFDLITLGDPIKVFLKKSTKAKNIIIRINCLRVELILPICESKERAIKFLYSKEQAIRNKLKSHPIDHKKDFNIIPILGKDYQLEYINKINLLPVEMHDNIIKIYGPENKSKQLLVTYLKKYILIKITELIKELSKEYQFKYQKIAVKNLATRWGSCSSSGNLSFNWRIVFAPINVLEYLVIHEFCHLKEMNHQKNFWDLVAKIRPDYKSSIKWLKQHGNGLYKYF